MQNCLAAPCSIVLRHVETDDAGWPEPVTIRSCMGLVDAKDSHRTLFRDRRQGARKACSWRTRGHSPAASKRWPDRRRSSLKSASVAPRKARQRASCCQRLVVLSILTSGNPKRVRATFHWKSEGCAQTKQAWHPRPKGGRFNHRLGKVGRVSRCTCMRFAPAAFC